MLANEMDIGLGFTSSSYDRTAVEDEALVLSGARGGPVAIWREDDEYTGFLVEGGSLALEAMMMSEFRDAELVGIVSAN